MNMTASFECSDMGRKFANYRYDTDFGIKFYVLFPFEIILDFRGPAKSISDLSTVPSGLSLNLILTSKFS